MSGFDDPPAPDARPSVFLYGLPGGGKSFAGERLRDAFGYRFEEGDAWLTDDLKASLARGEGFTAPQRDAFCGVVVRRAGEAVAEAATGGRGPVAVAQAMFKPAHRARIAEAAPGLLFVHAACDELMRCARLTARTNGNVDAANGARMADDFEPGAADPILRGGAGVDAKLDKLLASARGWESLSLHRDHSRLPRCACGNAVHPLQRSLDGVARDVCWRCPLVAEY